MSSIYCQYNQWKFNKVLGGVDAKRVAINHLISSNPQDRQWEMYSYPQAAFSSLCWKPWRSLNSAPPGFENQGFYSALKVGAILKRPWFCFCTHVGWSLALCVCLRGQRGCVTAFLSLHFHCLYLCSQCEEVKNLLLISPTIRTVLLQWHHPYREGHFPCSPQDKEIPGTHLCLSSPSCSLSQVFTCKKPTAHLEFTVVLAGTSIPWNLKSLQEHPAL